MNEILVGIDFGTTNTVITHFTNNKAVPLVDGIFKTIPSKIGKINDKLYCGNYIPINCQNIIHSFKVSIGEKNTFILDDKTYTHTDLLVIFFKHLKDLIIKKYNCGSDIIKSVITVPSNFNDHQRELIRGSFEYVGFNVIRIINEPSAAALAYGLNYSSNSEEKILVVDTGGGTMDFTILEKNELFFEVIHSEGLNDLGGNNFTQLIYDDIIRTQSLKLDSYSQILWNQSQKIKEKLTYLDSYEASFCLNDFKINHLLTRHKFENLTNNLIQKVESVLNNIIQEYKNINYVILVGGTSRIPFLQNIIKKITNKNPWIHPHLETVVAEGAGLYAGIIENKYQSSDDVFLMDVLPLSLGVELVDGSYSIIIPKNTPLPIKRSQKYTTDSPADSDINIKIYQGERKIANKNFLIGEFIFDKVSLGGVPIIEIIFKIDFNSIINVTIIDRKSGVEKNISIKDIPKFDNVDLIIEQSNNLADLDDLELSRIQNIYLIKTHIENVLINLQINDLISNEDKQYTLDKFKIIDDTIDEMNNLQLIETIKYLHDNFSLLGSSNNDLDQNDDKLDDVEKLFFNDKKTELKSRVEILLAKNPEWEEFLNPVLENLSYNTITIDYINEKITLLDELENEDENIKDYKQEVNNLCLYLKNELETGTIDLGKNNNEILISIINENLNLIEQNCENNWEAQLNILNKKCEELYKN